MNRFYPDILRPLQLTFLLLLSLSSGFAADRSAATVALQEGRLDQAILLLRSSLAANPNDALSHNLLCRAFYAEEKPDAAIPECEAAVAHDPSSSDFALWLGRAYGMKAEHGGPLTGFSMARRVHSMFERAVQLDRANVHAMSDLGEFYVNAPTVVGGSFDKAAQLAAQLRPISPAHSHRLLAQLAERRGDYATAEQEFKAQVASERAPESLVDLGLFYHRRNRIDEAVATLKSAAELDHADDASLIDIAGGLNDMQREPYLVVQLLRRYLDSPARSEVAPAVRVHVLLGRILARSGETAAARREFEAALSLASSYAPASAELNKLSPS